jgi:hypothetical protein
MKRLFVGAIVFLSIVSPASAQSFPTLEETRKDVTSTATDFEKTIIDVLCSYADLKAEKFQQTLQACAKHRQLLSVFLRKVAESKDNLEILDLNDEYLGSVIGIQDIARIEFDRAKFE